MSILSKAVYRFSAIPLKIPMAFFAEIEQTVPKICMEPQMIPNSQNNLEKEEQN